tara:strand:- start:241 stop:669 length:429 start_codon:yes stop_codon:yes gene_type:complete
MFKINKLQNIHNSINKKNFNLKNELAKCRKEYDLNPEYLYLMGFFLKLENRPYLAIDALILSLKIDNDEMFLLKKNYEKCSNDLIKKKIDLLFELFSLIKNSDLINLINKLKKNQNLKFFLKNIEEIMPGINLNNPTSSSRK